MDVDKKEAIERNSNNGETLKERLDRLNKNLELCRKYKEETVTYVKKLEGQYRKRIFSYTEYEYMLNKYLKGYPLEYWVQHYEDQEKKIKEKLKTLKLSRQKFTFEKQAFTETRPKIKHTYYLMYGLAVLILALGLALSYSQVFETSFGNLITGFSVSETNESANNIPVIYSYTPENDISINIGESQTFTITASDADKDELSIGWYVDVLLAGQTSESFTFTPTEPGKFEIKVLVHDFKDYTSHKWVLTATAKEEEAAETINETLPEETYEILPEEPNATIPEGNRSEETPEINETAENVTLPELNETIIGNLTEEALQEALEKALLEKNIITPENIIAPAQIEESTNPQIISVDQLPAEINKPVRWVVRAKTNNSYLEIEIPPQATAISVERITELPTLGIGEIREAVPKENITIKQGLSSLSLSSYEISSQSMAGFFTVNMQNKGLLSTVTDWLSFQFVMYKALLSLRKTFFGLFRFASEPSWTALAIAEGEKTILVINDYAEKLEINYSTPAPRVREEEGIDTKIVTVYADINYTDILTYTSVNESKNVSNVVWLTNGAEENMTYQLHDEDSNGITDKVSWVTPHLTEQTFKVLFSEEQGYVNVTEQDYANITLTAEVYINISADEIYYITNCPHEYCGPPNDPNVAKLEENSDDFYAVTNLQTKVMANDFGAQMKFDISNKPENFTQAFICSYAKEKMLIESLTNYVEVLDDTNKPLPIEGVEPWWASSSMDRIPGWNCIDITGQLKQKNDAQLIIRWWGQDSEEKEGTAQFARFLAFSPLEKCEGYNPSNASDCRPYLRIKL